MPSVKVTRLYGGVSAEEEGQRRCYSRELLLMENQLEHRKEARNGEAEHKTYQLLLGQVVNPSDSSLCIKNPIAILQRRRGANRVTC